MAATSISVGVKGLERKKKTLELEDQKHRAGARSIGST